jgi:hypothetical protein
MHKDVYVTETDAKPKTIIQKLREQQQQQQQEKTEKYPGGNTTPRKYSIIV